MRISEVSQAPTDEQEPPEKEMRRKMISALFADREAKQILPHPLECILYHGLYDMGEKVIDYVIENSFENVSLFEEGDRTKHLLNFVRFYAPT